MDSYHLRITAPSPIENNNKDKDTIPVGALTAKQFLTDIFHHFDAKFKPTQYIVAYEEASDHNKHLHAHLEYDGEAPKKQTISDFFKKHKLTGKYYHQLVKTNAEKNKQYIAKDLDIITHNLKQSEYDELIEQTLVINEDKKKDARKKILEAFKVHIMEVEQEIEKLDELQHCKASTPYCSLNYIAWFIHKLYINEYDKEPPTYRMKGYVLYVAEKMNQVKELKYIGYNTKMYYEGFM